MVYECMPFIIYVCPILQFPTQSSYNNTPFQHMSVSIPPYKNAGLVCLLFEASCILEQCLGYIVRRRFRHALCFKLHSDQRWLTLGMLWKKFMKHWIMKKDNHLDHDDDEGSSRHERGALDRAQSCLKMEYEATPTLSEVWFKIGCNHPAS